MSPGKSVLGLCGWLALSFAAAAPGAFFMPGDWYASLQKPLWNPPGWIFGSVCFALYALMAVAVWLLVPYLAWVTFAAVLNGTLWRMNP